MKKSVLITGATVNTGFEIAEKFAKEGYVVFIGSRSQENADAAAKKFKKSMEHFPKDMR